MKSIAIIAAEDKENEAVLEMMSDVSCEKVFNIDVYKGKIKDSSCILAKSGVGKVNASRTAQILIDRFDVECLINVGAAGATDTNLKIGDVVISTGLVQHDFDVTAFGREKGFISEVGKIFEADSKLVEKCEKVITSLGLNYEKGIIASGDRFICNKNEKAEIKDEFDAICVEMEGAAIAHVCKLCNIPFLVIRSISDELSGDAKVDFEEFLEIASRKCAAVIYNMV